MHKVLSVFLLSATLASLVLVVDFGLAQASTSVSGVLTQDTVWTKQGSPYVFTGAVGVAAGVTLTVEAGVTVDLGSYYLEVNGTLNVEGTEFDETILTSDENLANGLFIGWVDAYPLASGHNNIAVAFGNPTCTFQHAILNNTSLFGQGLSSSASVTIDNCGLLNSAVNIWGKTTITNSFVTGAVHLQGVSSLVGNTFLGGIEISDYTRDGSLSGNYQVLGNNITNTGDVALMAAGLGTISNNNIYGADRGITQDDKTTLSATIERNLIKDNNYGIYLRDDSDDAIIKDNTITENKVGIYNPSYKLTIAGNSFLDNEQYDIRAGSDAVNAKDNWWGTTDRAAIAEKIFDSNDDFSLGTVVYLPVLTGANSNAPDRNMCPTEQVTSTPMPTAVESINYQMGGQANASLSGLEIGVIVTVAVVALLVAVVALRASRKSRF